MPTFTLRRWVALAAVLFCSCLARAATAQDLLLGASSAGDPFTSVWVDSSQGVTMDSDLAKQVATQYSTTDWAFFDNNQLVIGKNAQPVLTAFYVGDEDRTFFLVHRRAQNVSVDGVVVRDPSTKEGLATLFIITSTEDGSSTATAYLEFDLKFLQ
jgi:hypothetical protein